MEPVKSVKPIKPVEPVKVLAVGDPHFKENNLDDLKKFCDNFYTLAKQLKPDLIVLLGDIHDRHGTNNIYPATHSNEFIYECWKITNNIALVVGNHDRVDNQDYLSKYNFFNSYKNWKGVVVAEKVREMNLKGHRFIFVPYVYPGRFMEALETIDQPMKCSCIFSHQEFYGAQYGRKSEIGDKWPLDGPLVVSGHIHDYQRINANIIYTGTPVTHTFGREKRKTVSLFTFGGTKGGSISEKWTEERFKVESVQKIKIQLNPNELLKWKYPGPLYKIRIEVLSTNEQYTGLCKSGFIGNLKKLGVSVRQKYPDKKDEKRVKVRTTGTFLRQLQYLMVSETERTLFCKVFGFQLNIFEKKNTKYVIHR